MVRFDYDIGDRIAGKRGEYRVKQRLGAGGMGACYLVEDTDAPHLYVLKTMQSQLASKPRAREAFELEARGLIALHDSPNIVHAFQLDVTPTGVPFYLMEHLHGLSLREMLRMRKRLHVDVAISIGVGLASALEYAHEKKVVHCDVKPDNIFVVQRAEGIVVKLLDFGAMKSMLVSLGYAGQAGTLNYMAPEQLRREEVDARADLFAAGVVLYEMIAGKHPFAEYGIDEKGAMARIDKLPLPLNRVVSDMPWQLVNVFDDLILKLLEPSPERRSKHASGILVKLHHAKRVQEQLAKGDVHNATTNPAGPPGELIAQTTGVIDEEALSPKTDPHLDLSSEPELAAAIAASADFQEQSTKPPTKPLPPPARDLAYVETAEVNSYDRAEAAAQLLESKAKPKAKRPASSGGLELTSGEREYVDNLGKHVKEKNGGLVLEGRPRGNAAATVIEDDDYHRRLRRKRDVIVMSRPMMIAFFVFVFGCLGVGAYVLLVRR